MAQGIWPFFMAQAEGVGGVPTTAMGALIVGFVSMTGLMVWIVKRLLDTTVPGMQAAFQTAQDRQATANQAALDRLLTSFQTAQNNFQKIVERNQDECKKERLEQIAMLTADGNATRKVYEEKSAAEREFFQKTIEMMMTTFERDRQRAFASVETNQVAIRKVMDEMETSRQKGQA